MLLLIPFRMVFFRCLFFDKKMALDARPRTIRKKSSASEKQGAGATETASKLTLTSDPAKADIEGKLLEFAWWMKKQGYAEATITTRLKLLRILIKRGSSLENPESIKETIARQKWAEKRKASAVDAYTCFLKMHKLSWEPPSYKEVRRLPFIPTEGEMEQLISSCPRKLVPLLQLLKETGMRIGEAVNLTWTDIDFERSAVRITPEKGSNARVLPISSKLKAMLLELQGRAISEMVFPNSVRNLRRSFQRQRKIAAFKLHNPRIDKITFHTFRHFKATMEYYRTKDILHVMEVLGHRNIKNTLIYTHLVDFRDDEYISKVANTVEEACKLVEAGFDYVCQINGVQIFRKRK